MKFSPRIVSSLAASALSVATIPTTSAVPPPPPPTTINTCAAQFPCLKFTFESVTPLPESDYCDDGEPCEYKVCMKLDYSPTGCKKEGPVELTCAKDETICLPTPCAMTTPFAFLEQGLNDGDEWCQVVEVGGIAEFLLTDGGDTTTGCGTFSGPLTNGGSATCETFDERSCSGSTNEGRECVWAIKVPSECGKTGGGGGDPHIKLWNSTRYSYHGECDLVLLENKDFHNGLGMDIHIRATHKPYVTIPSFYSFIESAAIRIGDDVLEFSGDDFWINGELRSDNDLPATISDGFTLRYPTYSTSGKAKYYQLDLNHGDHIVINKYSSFLYVDISGNTQDFGTSVGLLGDYHTSAMLARDGMTVLHNPDDFGSEWQVRGDEPKLFRDSTREPQHPHASCKVPETSKEQRRHLLEQDPAMVSAAQAACANKKPHDYEFCVHDVLATKDIGMAEAW